MRFLPERSSSVRRGTSRHAEFSARMGNDEDWFEALPPGIDKLLIHKLCCRHFFCHVARG